MCSPGGCEPAPAPGPAVTPVQAGAGLNSASVGLDLAGKAGRIQKEICL